jgi:hypothetical protein
VLWGLTAPDLAGRLVNHRGWGWDRFQRRLGAAMADALLGPGVNAPGMEAIRQSR